MSIIKCKECGKDISDAAESCPGCGCPIGQRIIGVGDIAIGTAASAGTEISIVGIANPSEVIAEINSLRK